jgi:hypothetical protein
MVTTVGTESTPPGLVENLLLLEHDTIAAYDQTIEPLQNPSHKQKIVEFRADHDRHVQELSRLAAAVGAMPYREGDAKQMLTTGKVALASIMGDSAILTAMRSNEEDTVTARARVSPHESDAGLAASSRGRTPTSCGTANGCPTPRPRADATDWVRAEPGADSLGAETSGRAASHEADDRGAPRGPAPAHGRADRAPRRPPGGGTRRGGARRPGAGCGAARARHRFVPAPLAALAYNDALLPTGFDKGIMSGK